MTEQKRKKAFIAMSGGVDSSVAALIATNSGMDCVGVTLKLFKAADEDKSSLGTRAFDEDEDEFSVGIRTFAEAIAANGVAKLIGIPHHIHDNACEFTEFVIDYFIDAYANGLTPNPCIECNRRIKLGMLLDQMKIAGYDYVVTGHYARIVFDETKRRFLLLRAKDRSKDQSYMLYTMTQDQLAHTLFPLGDLSKSRVREIAAENGFKNAEERDSQDICFVPDGDYAGFIERHLGQVFPEGDYIDTEGRVIGRHKGIIRYTIGQRKGLGAAFGVPHYVLTKDAKRNAVVLGSESMLYSKRVLARDVNLISVDRIIQPMRVTAKTRYTQHDMPATVVQTEEGRLELEFDEPQRAAAPGQALVIYDGDVVVGGGTII